MELKGLYTALITPFRNGEVDYGKLAELVEAQIKGGVDGIVPVGTTGESPTLPTQEHLEVLRVVVEAVRGRCQVIAGTGANSTAEAVELTIEAAKLGVGATLQVTPYYNKPTQEGLYRHFSKVADEGGLPVVLYNIPGRSGVPIAIETIARLSANANVVGVKEAGGSVERVCQILDACATTVLSGDDSLTLPMMAVGARGVISVVSNLCPARLRELLDAFFAGDIQLAQRLNAALYPLFRDLFIETNPIPIKAAMAARGMVDEEYRLPLCPMSEKNRAQLLKTMEAVGV